MSCKRRNVERRERNKGENQRGGGGGDYADDDDDDGALRCKVLMGISDAGM